MKKTGICIATAIIAASAFSAAAGKPVEMLAYSMPDGNGGMKLATRSAADKEWRSLGNGWTFLNSDFGAWGRAKKMHNVRMAQDENDNYWVIFNPDAGGEVVAYTWSPDLETWKPQAPQDLTS